VLYGLLGVGKSVLLTDFAKTARGHDWIVAQFEAGTSKSLREALGEAVHGPLADLARPSAGRKLLKALKTARSFKASYDATGSWNFGVDLTEKAGGGADTGVLETDLAKLVQDLSSGGRGRGSRLGILIDEAQDLSAAELVAICAAAHTAGQDSWPALFALAGHVFLPLRNWAIWKRRPDAVESGLLPPKTGSISSPVSAREDPTGSRRRR
jgi:hypothetical protein